MQQEDQTPAEIQKARAVQISGTLKDFLTNHLTYSMLQSIPIPADEANSLC